MIMDRRIILIFLAVLLLGAIAYIILPQDSGDYAKIIVVTLHAGNEGVSPVSEEIRYGHSPTVSLVNGAFRGTFTDADGNVVQEFGIHDPRIQFGDRIAAGSDGSEVLSGMTVVADEADLLLIVPYTGLEETFVLSDAATGEVLATTDLSAAAGSFKAVYPEDPDIVASAQRTDREIPLPLIAGGCVLLILLAAVIAHMIRRK